MGKVEDYREQLSALPTRIERHAEFAYGGYLTNSCDPDLVVDGEAIGFPLLAAQAESLKQRCSLAPFGRGEKTLLDTKVRNTWQLDASRVGVGNPQFGIRLTELVKEIGIELGLEGVNIRHELYKLLLYEEGSFFAPHRDSEKVNGMFGTLVLLCPSSYRGGELLIRHGDHARCYDFAEKNGEDFHFVAFYADCRHEIRRILEGFRICLVYNLIYEGNPTSLPRTISSDQYEEAMFLFRSWDTDPSGVPRLVHLFEHRYSSAGLQYEHLKGRDRAVANFVRGVQEVYKIDAYLAIISVYSSGTQYFGFHLPSATIQAKSLVSLLPGKSTLDISELDLKFEDFLRKKDEEPEDEYSRSQDDFFGVADKEEWGEDTGNEGASIERWYQRSGLILIPRTLRWELLCKPQDCITTLRELVSKQDYRSRFLLNAILRRKQRESKAESPDGIQLALGFGSLLPLLPQISDLPPSCVNTILDYFVLWKKRFKYGDEVWDQIAWFVQYYGWTRLQKSFKKLSENLSYLCAHIQRAFLFPLPSLPPVHQDIKDYFREEFSKLVKKWKEGEGNWGTYSFTRYDFTARQDYFKLYSYFGYSDVDLQVLLKKLDVHHRHASVLDFLCVRVESKVSVFQENLWVIPYLQAAHRYFEGGGNQSSYYEADNARYLSLSRQLVINADFQTILKQEEVPKSKKRKYAG